MIDDTRFRDLARRLDPNSDDVISVVGRGRGFALNISILAMICATAATEEERAVHAAQLRETCDAYRAAMAEARERTSTVLGDRAMPERLVVRAFSVRVAALSEDGRIDRATAMEVARVARTEVLPALYRIITVLQGCEMERMEAEFATIAERVAITTRMMAEMDRIGKMIGLISINASVEAARAGGQSGRAFQVIAQEVRALAQQSAAMLGKLRGEMGATETRGAASVFLNRRRA